jgi:glycosyltransferase involved in cell wall biosynthesis
MSTRIGTSEANEMMSAPVSRTACTISVIIPTLRRPKLLMRAIGSVLAQTEADLELLVVIDGPDPETTAVTSTITDQRVRFIQNIRSLGSAETRNVGIRAAAGDWVAFLDDDDEWIADKLASQLALARRAPSNVIVSCLSFVTTPLRRYVWPNRVYDNTCPLDEYLFDRRTWFRGDVMLQCSSLFMSRQLAMDLTFRDPHDDWDLLLRAVKEKGAAILTVQRPLVVHYTEDDRSSLGASFDWRMSLDWVNEKRALLTSSAYAGFCLTIIGPQAAKIGDLRGFWKLLYSACTRGSPRSIQLVLYFLIWLVPIHRRQQLRSLLSRRPPRSV